MHRDDDDFEMDFVFDLESLELFETTPATRPEAVRPAPRALQAAPDELLRGGRLLRFGEPWLDLRE